MTKFAKSGDGLHITGERDAEHDSHPKNEPTESQVNLSGPSDAAAIPKGQSESTSKIEIRQDERLDEPHGCKASRRGHSRSMITKVMKRKKKPATRHSAVRHVVVVLADQLDRASAAFDGFDKKTDVVWMCEAREEFVRIPVSLPRIVMFVSAMRHFRRRLEKEGLRGHYHDFSAKCETLGSALRHDIVALSPQRVILLEPGTWDTRETLRAACPPVLLEERADRHFLCSHEEFEKHARGRKQLRMEFFYREMRRKYGVLLDADGEPEGGEWNYDAENRKSFGREGPGRLNMPAPVAFPPDAITRGAIDDIRQFFPENPGQIDDFDWPTTREQALAGLKDFIDKRLAAFGDHQDAMWTGEPWLFHSRISAALNLKLLNPKEVIDQVELAYRRGKAPLASVEGFIRQILGWREYVRGVYWRYMPQYLERNAFDAQEPLPNFFGLATHR